MAQVYIFLIDGKDPVKLHSCYDINSYGLDLFKSDISILRPKLINVLPPQSRWFYRMVNASQCHPFFGKALFHVIQIHNVIQIAWTYLLSESFQISPSICNHSYKNT